MHVLCIGMQTIEQGIESDDMNSDQPLLCTVDSIY